MFKVVTERRKRPFWTPRTVAVSVGAHVLLLGAFVTAAESTPARPGPDDGPIIYIPTDPPVKQPEPPKTPEPPRKPDAPEPKKGDFVTPRPPDAVPDKLPTIDPHLTRLTDHDVRGIGVEGDVIGTPDGHHDTPTTGQTDNLPNFNDGGPMEPENVSVLPKLSNEREAQRMLQRVYPPALRDAGVAGHTVVSLIIDKQGNVEPGSLRVLESSHPGFDQAALRAVEKFHFTPAELNGHAVSVVIALPIDWQIEQR
jgi:protein TonB